MHYRYFVYDPFYVSEFFKTEEEALAYAEKILDNFREYAHTEGWGEDVEEIVVGKITHRIEKCNVITKKGELDEEGCDENGVHWSFPEWDEMYDYQFVRIGEGHE